MIVEFLVMGLSMLMGLTVLIVHLLVASKNPPTPHCGPPTDLFLPPEVVKEREMSERIEALEKRVKELEKWVMT